MTMSKRQLEFALAWSLACCSGFLSAAPDLKLDPFARPNLVENQAGSGFDQSPETKGVVFEPGLRGTMRSPRGSMANIDGEIIRIGEDFQGFRLLRVTDRSAVFEKFGKEYAVTMER